MAKKNRSIKVYGMSGHNYVQTPTIMLKGMWLREIGFDIGDFISVSCEDGKLVITPDMERTAVKEAEVAFMESEMKKLQAKFEVEKAKIHARFVAESKAQYGVCAE